MKKIVALCCALALTNVSQADVLYSNGPVVDSNHLSIVANGSGTFGFNAATRYNNFLADDFTVAANQTWNVASLDFFSYQSGNNQFEFTNARWSIVSGDVNSGTVVASGNTAVSNGGLVGYRVGSTTTTNTDRRIYRVSADITDTTLEAGHYWLRWSITGSPIFSGPWTPPTADGRPGNAFHSLAGGTFHPALNIDDNAQIDLPFVINGNVSAVPEPESWAMFLAGLTIVGIFARRRSSSQRA